MKKNYYKSYLYLFIVFMVTCKMFASQSNNLSQKEYYLTIKKGTLELVLKQIEEQSPFDFSYDNNEVNPDQNIEIHSDKIELNEVLNQISKKHFLSFKIINNNIYVTKNKLLQEKHKVKGVVTDEKGMPLLGATVLELGTKNGTTTDFDGNYSIEVSKMSVLHISYIGYLTTS